MNPLKAFNKFENEYSSKDFFKYCKQIIAEKETRAKIVIQKAQQYIDDYLLNNKTIA